MNYIQVAQTMLYTSMGYDEAPDTLVRMEEIGDELSDIIERIDESLRPIAEMCNTHGGDLGYDGKELVFTYLREYLDREYGM